MRKNRMTLKLRWLTLKIAYGRWRLGDTTIAKSLLRTALGVTEKNELRAPGPIRELSEILDDITEDKES